MRTWERPEAVALQARWTLSERLRDCDSGFDVAAHCEKIVGVDVLIMLKRANRQSA